jgi:hypothetical protein
MKSKGGLISTLPAVVGYGLYLFVEVNLVAGSQQQARSKGSQEKLFQSGRFVQK